MIVYFIELLLCEDIEDIIEFFVVIDVFYWIVFEDLMMVWVDLINMIFMVGIYLFIYVLIVILFML